MGKVIMIQGTASNAGKSILTAGLCRVFKQDGYQVAPFKSQNMALNSYITKDGLEMGRAQAIQAEAAGIEPSALMNPVLLKPTGDASSQIIVNGQLVATMKAVNYYAYKKELFPIVEEAYKKLEAENDLIVIEGAGSPAEINLKADDFVNMGMAKIADAPVLLIGDIDRGGVFASLYGTLALLEPEEKQRVKGIIINKFRGDVALLKPGLAQLEELTGVPVVGVVPYLQVDIEEEDSSSEKLNTRTIGKSIDIAVVRFPRISNFSDFTALERQPGIGIRYVKGPRELGNPDMIILPGTQNPMADLSWLRQNGLEAAIKQLACGDTPILGIGGGYQIMGNELQATSQSEGPSSLRGMELLPVKTVLGETATQRRVEGTMEKIQGFYSFLSGLPFKGYEISGGSIVTAKAEGSLCSLKAEEGKRYDGFVKNNLAGSMVHGIFENDQIAVDLAKKLSAVKGLDLSEGNLDYSAYKEEQFNLLAEGLRKSLDFQAIYNIIGIDK